MTRETIRFSGVDGETGDYLGSPVEIARAAALARLELGDYGQAARLEQVAYWRTQPHLGLGPGVEPADVRQSGWAIVFHADESQAVCEAFEPLIAHRRRSIGDARTKVLTVGEHWLDWLERHGVMAGSVEPTKVPYYILLIGDPTRIPYDFQHELETQHAVGRLDLELDGYRRYVQSLLEYETGSAIPHRRRAAFFAPRHPSDGFTRLAADQLVFPLARGRKAVRGREGYAGVVDELGFATTFLRGDEATKAALMGLIQDGRSPLPLLFSASHGLGWERPHPRQIELQGALICQDWPGIGSLDRKHYFSAADVADAASVHGMVTFHFACYSAGTPRFDRFPDSGFPDHIQPQTIADPPFTTALAKRLLSHPEGAVLAVIGHLERVWGWALGTPVVGPQPEAFRRTIRRILLGQPLGHALKDFRDRYATLSTKLLRMHRIASIGGSDLPDEELAATWLQRNDAEGYTLLGDPATRLRVELMSAAITDVTA